MPNRDKSKPRKYKIERAAVRAGSKVDLDHLEKLCAIGCTQREIASFFGMTERAIELRKAEDVRYERKLESGEVVHLTFREIMERGADVGKVSIRRKQMQVMEDGNPTILIWLGKNRLEQRDNIDTTVSAPGGGPLEAKDATAREKIEALIARVSSRETAGGDPQST